MSSTADKQHHLCLKSEDLNSIAALKFRLFEDREIQHMCLSIAALMMEKKLGAKKYS